MSVSLGSAKVEKKKMPISEMLLREESRERKEGSEHRKCMQRTNVHKNYRMKCNPRKRIGDRQKNRLGELGRIWGICK